MKFVRVVSLNVQLIRDPGPKENPLRSVDASPSWVGQRLEICIGNSVTIQINRIVINYKYFGWFETGPPISPVLRCLPEPGCTTTGAYHTE